MISTVPHRIRRPLSSLEQYLCPIIGTCLTLKELKKIAMRFGYKEEITPYVLHSSMVQACINLPFVSKYVQKYLSEKYWPIMRRIDRVEGEDLSSAWREALNDGEIAGAFWGNHDKDRYTIFCHYTGLWRCSYDVSSSGCRKKG